MNPWNCSTITYIYFQVPSASGNDVHESSSMSLPSDEDVDVEIDPAESLFKQQAKFFYQMKDYLLSQQSSLRQQLELLNATVASRKSKKVTASRRQRFLTSGHSVHHHIATKPKPDVPPADIRGNNNHDLDLMNEFLSCSSTEKSGELWDIVGHEMWQLFEFGKLKFVYIYF